MNGAVLGIGTDLLYVPRMRALWERYPQRLLKKILSPAEQAKFHDNPPAQPAVFLAKRFAIKEAVVKAFGTGFRDGVRFEDICVFHDEWGKPLLSFTGRLAVLQKAKGIRTVSLSLSDEKEYVLAFAVALS